MKPRLKSLDLTVEDLFIWGARWGGIRTLECTTLASISKIADRRDAVLMLMIERTRLYGRQFRPADYPYCMVHCLMRAELQDSGTFNWY